jgi:hypothetical protein
MSLRINDLAPDFTAQTTHGLIRARQATPSGRTAAKPYLRVVPSPKAAR